MRSYHLGLLVSPKWNNGCPYEETRVKIETETQLGGKPCEDRGKGRRSYGVLSKGLLPISRSEERGLAPFLQEEPTL